MATHTETLEIPLEDVDRTEGGCRFSLQPPAHDKQGARVSTSRLPLFPRVFPPSKVFFAKGINYMFPVFKRTLGLINCERILPKINYMDIYRILFPKLNGGGPRRIIEASGLNRQRFAGQLPEEMENRRIRQPDRARGPFNGQNYHIHSLLPENHLPKAVCHICTAFLACTSYSAI